MRNLTRDEAGERAGLLDVASYDVHLDLRENDAAFTSVTEVRFACRAPGASTFVELDGEALDVALNGRPVGPAAGNRIPLTDLQTDNVLTVRAQCATSRSGEGLHRFVDPADGSTYLYAQSFLDDAQRIFACFDQPDLKAVFRLTVDAPPGWTVVANGRGRREGDRWTFAPTASISTYLFTVAAGPFHGEQRWYGEPGDGGIELGAWCRRSLAEHLEADELFEITAQSLDLQQQLFGRRYPFGDTYDQLFVPEFNAGAMENPGAVTFSEDLLFRSRVTEGRRRTRAMVIAHELSHMWFGDLVTMRWWEDLWLNESFAELMGFLTTDRATRFTDAWTDFSTSRKAWGYRADALPTTHPVAGTARDTRSALLDFDGISYAKGASVLRQLMAVLGEDAFFAGVRAYFDRYAHANTGVDDLLAELERASGRDLSDWSRSWLRTPGTSTLRTVVTTDAVQVHQSVPDDHPVLREHRLGVGLYDLVGERLELRRRLDVVVDGEVTELPIAPAERPDLLLVNDGDLTFAKLRLDDRSLRTVAAHLHRLPDPLARALCWSALWDTTRDAELAPAAFVDAVLAGVPAEADPSVVETLLGQARTAAALYAADGELLLRRLSDASWQACRAAVPGSDLQLAQLRASAIAAVDLDQRSRLAALLDGTDAPAGLTVDTDLRWLLVQRVCALGGDVDLDAEAERDRTADGRRQLLLATAARPDPDGKLVAFDRATGDDALSSKEAQALAAGLWQYGQDDACRPLVARYADAVPRLWTERSPHAAQALTRLLFPSLLPEPAVLDAVDGLLASDLPAGARRVVLEQRDDLARALRARMPAPNR
jgi:aminopeptidase N